jgi:hypothetical protein
MPHNPHWYVLRREWNTTDEDFVRVVRFICRWGFRERWPPAGEGHWYTVIIIGGFKYRTMGARCEPGPSDGKRDNVLINRKPVAARDPQPQNGRGP